MLITHWFRCSVVMTVLAQCQIIPSHSATLKQVKCEGQVHIMAPKEFFLPQGSYMQHTMYECSSINTIKDILNSRYGWTDGQTEGRAHE